MKKKFFFMTLGLFVIFLNVSILFIAIYMLKDTIETQKQRCLAEHYVIVSSMVKDMQAIESRDGGINDSAESILLTYSYFSQDRKLELSLYEEDNLVYSNMHFDDVYKFNASELLVENRMLSMHNGKDNSIISIVGRFPSPYERYLLVYQFDIQNEINEWRQTRNTLILLGVVLSLVLTICLLLLTKHLFRPLKRISKASRLIAQGEYKNRIPVLGDDELAELSRNFNHMADEIDNHMTQLQDVADRKQQFIDNFAHELRTPLTTIYGYAEYIQKVSLSDSDRNLATSYILSECKRMQNMSYQLLDLAMLREEKITFDKINLSEFFCALNNMLKNKLSTKKINITFEATIEFIFGNKELLQNLFINLVENAIKACEAGGSIAIYAYKDNNNKIILVKDNGKGMTEEQLSHIKEAFYRVDKVRSRADGGTGLGLAICEQIAKLHNANLLFKSEPGKGTEVKIIFTT